MPQQDISSFYLPNLSVLPRANGVDDMPASGWLATVGASFRNAQRDIPGHGIDEDTNQYAGLVNALSEANGKPWTHYVSTQTGQTDRDGVWRDIAELRKTNAEALKGVPATREQFDQQAADKASVRVARDQLTEARGPWTARLTGGMGASFTDPFVLPTFLIGGGTATTAAGRVLSQGLVNAGLAAAEQPLVAIERSKRGESLSLGEAATNVATAGVFGAGVQGAVMEPLHALFKRIVGVGNMTEAEQGAVNVLERQNEVAASSPFQGGAGAETHAARLQSTIDAATSGVPPVTNPAMAARDVVMSHIAGTESGGRLNAKNPNSSATGLYQFIDSTWLRYYTRRYGRGGLSEAQILAQRTDPAIQTQLMRDMLADNSAALARDGFSQSPGNLYLMHFAGQGGGLAILKADAATPIERILGDAAIEKNAFLRGHTAKDVVDWAHAKMGNAPEAPPLKREGFGDDASWQRAQVAADAAEVDRVQAEARARIDAGTPEPDRAAWTAIDPQAEPASWQLMHAERWIEAAPGERPTIDAGEIVAPKRGFVPPERTRPSDVLEFLSDRGGLANDGADALSKGKVSAATGKRRSGMDWHLQMMPNGAGSLVRKGGLSIDQAGELLHEAGFSLDRMTKADVIDLIDRAVRGEKIYPLQHAADMADIARARKQASDWGFAENLSDQLGISQNDPLFEDILWRAADHGDAERAFEEALIAESNRRGARLQQETGDQAYGPIDDGFDAAFDAGTAPRDAGAIGHGPAADTRGPSGGEATGAASGPAAEALNGFEDPATGAAAKAQIESLEHDVRMMLVPAAEPAPQAPPLDGRARYNREFADLWRLPIDELDRLHEAALAKERDELREALRMSGAEIPESLAKLVDSGRIERAGEKVMDFLDKHFDGDIPEAIDRMAAPRWDDFRTGDLPVSDDVAELQKAYAAALEDPHNDVHMVASEIGWALRGMNPGDLTDAMHGAASITTQAKLLTVRLGYDYMRAHGVSSAEMPRTLHEAMVRNGVDPGTAAELTDNVLRMLKDEAPAPKPADAPQLPAPAHDPVVDYGADGQPRLLSTVLAELDREDAAIAEAQACMAPPGADA